MSVAFARSSTGAASHLGQALTSDCQKPESGSGRTVEDQYLHRGGAGRQSPSGRPRVLEQALVMRACEEWQCACRIPFHQGKSLSQNKRKGTRQQARPSDQRHLGLRPASGDPPTRVRLLLYNENFMLHHVIWALGLHSNK